MFQFPGFPELVLCIQTSLTGHYPSRVSPFGDPWIVGWLTPPQGLSQFPTSFIGSRCQGIHHVLINTCCKDLLALAMEFSKIALRVTGLPVNRPTVPISRSLGELTLPQSCTRCPKNVAGRLAWSHHPAKQEIPQTKVQRTYTMNSQWFTWRSHGAQLVRLSSSVLRETPERR
jgi:hypothetical protein